MQDLAMYLAMSFAGTAFGMAAIGSHKIKALQKELAALRAELKLPPAATVGPDREA